MSSKPLTERQFDEAWEDHQAELNACPSPVREKLNEGLAAHIQAGQGRGYLQCAACGGCNVESCCHPAEFCQAICNDCNTPLNADGSLWVDQTEAPFFVPSGATVLGSYQHAGVTFPFGAVNGGFFKSDEFGWGWWPSLMEMIAALSIRLEEAASAINFGAQEPAHTPSVVPAGNTGTTNVFTGQGA